MVFVHSIGLPQIDIGIKMPPYVPAPQDLITTLLENLLMSLQNKADRLNPVGKTRQPRLLVSSFLSLQWNIVISSSAYKLVAPSYTTE